MQKPNRLKFVISIIIELLLFLKVQAQTNYTPGYIINLKGDTIYGFLDYRNWGINPKTISFKASINELPITFKSTELKEFHVANEIYASGIVYIETSPGATDALNSDPEIHLKLDTVFLQTLMMGEKSLYYFKDSYGKENLYIKENNEFQLLEYKRYFKNVGEELMILENKRYLGQLTVYLQDCPAIQSKIKNSTYAPNSLLNVFKAYYDCTNSKVGFIKQRDKISIESGIFAGISTCSLQFKGDNFYYLEDTKFNQSVNFTAGAFLDIVLPRNQKKFSVTNELIFSSYKVTGSSSDYTSINNYANTTYEMGYSYIKLNNLLRFKYPIKRSFIFVNLGISNGFALSEKNNQKTTSRFYSTISTSERPVLFDTRKYEQGLILGIGARFQKLSFEARHERANGMTAYPGLKSSTRRFYFLLSFRFL